MTHKYAEMWWCEDAECDCTQPRIVARSESGFNQAGWVPPVIVEEGEFISQANEAERIEQGEWLLKAARRHEVKNLAEIEQRYSPANPKISHG